MPGKPVQSAQSLKLAGQWVDYGKRAAAWRGIGPDAEAGRKQRPMTYAETNSSNEYLRTKVLTASPEQLQLLLYDAAVRFARQGRDALAGKDLEAACEKLLRAQKIVLELNAALRHDLQPDLCRRVADLYHFIHRRLVEANLRRDISAADDAIELLEYQRETWRMLMEQLRGRSEPAGLAGPAAMPALAAGSAPSVNLAV